MHCKNSPCPAQGVNGHFSIRSAIVAPVRGRTPSPLTPPDTVRGRDVNEFATPEERQRIDDLQANRRAESTRDKTGVAGVLSAAGLQQGMLPLTCL